MTFVALEKKTLQNIKGRASNPSNLLKSALFIIMESTTLFEKNNFIYKLDMHEIK